MIRLTSRLVPALAALAAATALGAASANAQSIVDSWSSVALPPPPALEPVTIESAHMALLMLDFSVDTCAAPRRPTCVRSIPHVQRLLADARAHHALVVYSTGGAASTKTPDVLTPQADEQTVHSGVDKFLGTDLDKMLAAKGVKTVIVVGTSAHGAVLYTASSAALRGYTVVVPVDGYSAESPFAELSTAWLLKNSPASVSAHVTLTTTDKITLH